MELRCNKCGEKLDKPVDGKFYTICKHCGNQIITFKPYAVTTMYDKNGVVVSDSETNLSMQELAWYDTTKIKFLTGGYNTGKTTIDAFLVYMHLCEIPCANYVVGANTLKQANETFIEEFFKFCPNENIAYKQRSSNAVVIILKNGSTLTVVATDNEEKIKSMNLTGASMIEASGQDYRIFLQFKRRLRNKAAVVYDYDNNGNIKMVYNHKLKREEYKVKHSKLMLVVETNPEECWIYENEFKRAGKIFANKHRYPHNYTVTNPKRNVSFLIFDTMDNPYVDAEYIDDIIDEGIESVNKNIHGVLTPKSGYVFKHLEDNTIPDFDVLPEYIRAKAMDFGFNDPTTMCKCFIHPETGVVYVYGEYYQTQLLIPQHSQNLLPEITDEQNKGIRTYGGIKGDSSGKNKNFNDSKSTFDHYKANGITIYSASNSPIDVGVELMLSLMANKQLYIFESCVNLIRELRNYRYKPIKRDDDGRAVNKLDDKKYVGDDHLIDALRYIVMDLDINAEQRIKQVYGNTYYSEFLRKTKVQEQTVDYTPQIFKFRKKKKIGSGGFVF